MIMPIMTCNSLNRQSGLSTSKNNHNARMVSDNIDGNDDRLNLHRIRPQQITPTNNNEPIESRSKSPPAHDGNRRVDKVPTEIDESLIINFLKTYKHINAATLLMCTAIDEDDLSNTFEPPSSSSTPTVCPANTSADDDDDVAKTNCRTSSSFKFYVHIPKLMMAKSILIKACDIDGVLFRNNEYGPEAANTKWNEEGGQRRQTSANTSFASSRCQFEHNDGTSGSRLNGGWERAKEKLMTLLRSSVFHYGVILDLRCRQSGWVLEQVSFHYRS